MIDLKTFKENAAKYLHLCMIEVQPQDVVEICERAIAAEAKLAEIEVLDNQFMSNIIVKQAFDMIEQPDSAAPNQTDTNFCALNTITDYQVRKVARAFWRRIYPYRNNFERELGSSVPVEFMSFMATALTWVDKPTSKSRITEEDARKIMCAYNKYDAERNMCATYSEFLESSEGRALLDKLNEHREPDYKAQRDSLLAVTKALLTYCENLQDEGPTGSGWRSENLERYISEAETLIARCESN